MAAVFFSCTKFVCILRFYVGRSTKATRTSSATVVLMSDILYWCFINNAQMGCEILNNDSINSILGSIFCDCDHAGWPIMPIEANIDLEY